MRFCLKARTPQPLHLQQHPRCLARTRRGTPCQSPQTKHGLDCLAYAGDDLSRLPLHLRKTNLAQLLRGRAEGIFVAPFEQGEIGPDLFEAACRMGLEGPAWISAEG